MRPVFSALVGSSFGPTIKAKEAVRFCLDQYEKMGEEFDDGILLHEEIIGALSLAMDYIEEREKCLSMEDYDE